MFLKSTSACVVKRDYRSRFSSYYRSESGSHPMQARSMSPVLSHAITAQSTLKIKPHSPKIKLFLLHDFTSVWKSEFTGST